MTRNNRRRSGKSVRNDLATSVVPILADVLPPIPMAEKIECVRIDRLQTYEGHARKHPKRQIDKIVNGGEIPGQRGGVKAGQLRGGMQL